MKPTLPIEHYVFNVKFAFACKCFAKFLGDIESYVAWGAEAVLHKNSYKEVPGKYAANLQENTNAKATLLKSHFRMGVL